MNKQLHHTNYTGVDPKQEMEPSVLVFGFWFLVLGSCWVLLGFVGLCRVSLGFVGFLLGFVGFCWALLGFVGF